MDRKEVAYIRQREEQRGLDVRARSVANGTRYTALICDDTVGRIQRAESGQIGGGGVENGTRTRKTAPG